MSSFNNKVIETFRYDSNQTNRSQHNTNNTLYQRWIDLWHDIEADLGGLIKGLEQKYSQWQVSQNVGLNPAQSNAEWHAFISLFRREISRLNDRVHEYNHQVPLSYLQQPPYVADAIITKLPDRTG